MSIVSRVIRTFSFAACLLVVSGLGVFVLAEDKPQADDDRLDDAWQDAIGDQESILSDKQFAMLNNLAFQAAVTKICDGYELDQSKFAQAITDATSPPPNPDMTDDEIKVWETAVVMRLGATYGVLLAEGNAKPDPFCASANELKSDGEVPNVWK